MDQVLSTVQLQVLMAQRSVIGPWWNGSGTIDPFAKLYCIESGDLRVSFLGKEYDARPRDLLVIPPHAVLDHRCPRRAVVHWCHFTAIVLGGMDLFEYLQCRFQVRPSSPGTIQGWMERLIRMHGRDRPGEEFEAMGLLLQLLAPFVSTVDPDDRAARGRLLQRFGPVLAHMDAHLNQAIRLEDLARIIHLESTYFSSLFTRHFGTSPLKYLIHRRIERAQRLLWRTDDTLEAIAGQVGFTDAFHLSKTFKRITGISPSEFRKRKGRFP